MSEGWRCLAWGLALLGLVVLVPRSGHADAVVADLSSHSIAITTGFTGASVVLFGATDGPGDVIAVVRGPERDLTVWRKGKIVGVWANEESVTFANVPSFYAIAASRPLDEIVPPSQAALYRVGVDNLKFEARSDTDADRARLFAAAAIRVQQRTGLFPSAVGKIAFLGDRLFRTTFSFPANIPTGSYLVEIFLVRDREVVSGQTTPLGISKVGVDAAVFDFARHDALAYGAIAVMMAVMAGWIASLPFRST
jgi:uncharacterized protein (TIGR02186 family)